MKNDSQDKMECVDEVYKRLYDNNDYYVAKYGEWWGWFKRFKYGIEESDTQNQGVKPPNIGKRVKRLCKLILREMCGQVAMKDTYYAHFTIQGPRPKSRLNPFFAVICVLGKMFGADTARFEIQGVRVYEEFDKYIVEITLSNPGLLIDTMDGTLDNLTKELAKVFDKKCEAKIVEVEESFLSRQVINKD